MTSSKVPPTATMNIRTNVNVHEMSYERALVFGMLAQAQDAGDRTFTVTRDSNITVRRCPETLLDELALGPGWFSTRVNSATLTIRSEGLFGIIEATGTTEQCEVKLQLWADSTGRAETAKEEILRGLRPFEVLDVAFSLNWRFLDGKGDIKQASTVERASDPLLDEAYPILGGVKQFIDHYLNAPESVLVLQGTPGTGKTRLIRAILAALSRREGETADVLYTGDDSVLKSDQVFLEFITETHKAFVVEDADHLLAPRAEGNQMLHRFLNIADGIASAKGKKIIFSTNLMNVHDIDEALIRPGRCFAHVFLDELSRADAMRLLERLSGGATRYSAAVACLAKIADKTYSVAEVYAAHRDSGPQLSRTHLPRYSVDRTARRSKVGFV